MKKIILFVVLSFVCISLHAQFSSHIDGTPARIVKKIDVEGTELLNENWIKGSAKIQDGTKFNDIMLKYNVLEDVPYFQGKDDAVMLFTKPVHEFTLNGGVPTIFRSGFPAVGNFRENSYYQVLAEGKIILLKKIYKKITETREYNSATTVKKIGDNVAYYVFFEDKMIPLKKDKSFFINNFGKKEAMQSFFSSEKIDLKSDEGLVKVVNKYNSLP